MIIYKTTNLINGKIYIGQDSKNKNGYLGSGQNIKRAIKKYGKQNFKKEIIEKCNSIDELNNREKYWINFYNSKDGKIGYNLSNGGDSNLGYKWTKQQIEKNRNAMKKSHNRPEIKRKLSKSAKLAYKNGTRISPMKGRKKGDPIVDKICKKVSLILKKRYKNNELEVWNKNKKNCYTKKQLKNMSNGLKKHYLENGHPHKGKTYEQIQGKERAKKHKENLSKSHLGIKRSKESILKQIKTMKKNFDKEKLNVE